MPPTDMDIFFFFFSFGVLRGIETVFETSTSFKIEFSSSSSFILTSTEKQIVYLAAEGQ